MNYEYDYREAYGNGFQNPEPKGDGCLIAILAILALVFFIFALA